MDTLILFSVPCWHTYTPECHFHHSFHTSSRHLLRLVVVLKRVLRDPSVVRALLCPDKWCVNVVVIMLKDAQKVLQGYVIGPSRWK